MFQCEEAEVRTCCAFDYDLSKWDVSRVTDMWYMFANWQDTDDDGRGDSCGYSQHLCWDISDGTDTSGIFYRGDGCIDKTCGSVADSSLYC